MNIRKTIATVFSIAITLALTSCFGSKMASASGGEVTGTSGRAFTEPTPYGMTMVRRGHLHMGKVMWVVNKATGMKMFNTDFVKMVDRYMHRHHKVTVSELLECDNYSKFK